MPVPLRKGYSLGLRDHQGKSVRVPNDLMKSVVFLGDMDGDTIVPKGTGFFLAHKDFVYLVTAKHVATAQETFVVHVNMRDGTVGALTIDPECDEDWHLRWFHHPDPNVDVSVMPMHLDFTEMNIDTVAVLSGAAVPRSFPRSEVGCGDVCYALGLYSRHHGRTRLMPACHTGNVAMMADSKEPIPVKNTNGGQIIDVVGYLAELSNLPGLSGGPVFIRQALELNVPIESGEPLVATVATPELKLLGIWQGSWSDPDNWEEDVRKRGRQYVQLRMGIVVPAEFLMDLLDLPELMEHRARWLTDENAAHFDAAV